MHCFTITYCTSVGKRQPPSAPSAAAPRAAHPITPDGRHHPTNPSRRVAADRPPPPTLPRPDHVDAMLLSSSGSRHGQAWMRLNGPAPEPEPEPRPSPTPTRLGPADSAVRSCETGISNMSSIKALISYQSIYVWFCTGPEQFVNFSFRSVHFVRMKLQFS